MAASLFCKCNEPAYFNREAHEGPIGSFFDFGLLIRALRTTIVDVFAACANSLISVAHEDKDLLAPSRQDAKFGILFSYLGAFASLRELFRLQLRLCRWIVMINSISTRWERGSFAVIRTSEENKKAILHDNPLDFLQAEDLTGLLNRIIEALKDASTKKKKLEVRNPKQFQKSKRGRFSNKPVSDFVIGIYAFQFVSVFDIPNFGFLRFIWSDQCCDRSEHSR